MEIFDDAEAEAHFIETKNAGSFKNLVSGVSPAKHTNRKPLEGYPVPQHLKAEKTDDRFNDPVRMHGVEGERDASQPFKAGKKWHLEIGPDGRPAIVEGEQKAGGMKLSYDAEQGCVLVPADQPTVRPSFKPMGQKDYPGHN